MTQNINFALLYIILVSSRSFFFLVLFSHLLCVCVCFCVVLCVFYTLLLTDRASTSSARGGGGVGGALPDFFFFFPPCSADHERDWPPFKVVLSGWQPMR